MTLLEASPPGGTDASSSSASDASARDLVDPSCSWCEGPIPVGARRDAETCSQRCRQARHRFRRHVGRAVETAAPRRIAYADPPYPGMAARYYAGHPDYAGEVDHLELVRRLATYDTWALSTSAASLPMVLGVCGELGLQVRVAAWFRGERPTESFLALNGWEPVVYANPRPRRDVVDERRVDALVHVSRARTTDPRRVVGAKPARFAGWLFDLLGAAVGDTFDDLFPGSGGMARAWAAYTSSGDGDDASPAGGPDASTMATVDGSTSPAASGARG